MGNVRAKRYYDLLFALLGLLVLSPLLALIAAAIKISDGGPVFFRQERVGLYGRRFRIWKFRTMIPDADKLGLSVTRDGDARITRIGRLLRKSKLDELPQLWNVVAGDMSLVGPRPEVPRYVARYTPEQREILRLKPGITDLASLEFRNEEDILKSATDVEEFYLHRCVPRKIELNRLYAAQSSLWNDTRLILQTLSFWPRTRV
jgi:lipopolysaccharide/colanic/teichoic acid biosynthesis glycosyltransferase